MPRAGTPGSHSQCPTEDCHALRVLQPSACCVVCGGHGTSRGPRWVCMHTWLAARAGPTVPPPLLVGTPAPTEPNPATTSFCVADRRGVMAAREQLHSQQELGHERGALRLGGGVVPARPPARRPSICTRARHAPCYSVARMYPPPCHHPAPPAGAMGHQWPFHTPRLA